jgi:transposase
MKKNSTAKKTQKARSKSSLNEIYRLAMQERLTIGLDLGDRTSRYCILDEAGEVVIEEALPTTKVGLSSLFEKMPSSRVALEVGTHSPWVSRYLAKVGHEVIVANSHKVKLITHSQRKNDRVDAQKLARLARVDPKLLSPIRHRGEEAQADLAVIRARAELVEARTGLINCARGLVKPMGERLKNCDADHVGTELGSELSEAAKKAVHPLLLSIAAISQQIFAYDREIEEIGKRYPEMKLLKQVHGVGTLIALTFLLTVDDPERFQNSRDVGPFLGLQPGQRDSGDSQPQMGITKAGDRLTRTLLVQAAHCQLRKGAPESDLRDWGMSKQSKGDKKTKKRAVVAVARKIAVLLHHLWVTGEVYDPLYNRKAEERAAAKAQGKGGGKCKAAA